MASTDYCEDDVGFAGVNPLQIVHTKASISRLNGKTGNGIICTNRIPTAYLNKILGHASYSLPSSSASITEVMARTNPGRASVNGLAIAGELKDLPRLVRQLGNLGLATRRMLNRRPSSRRTMSNERLAADSYLGYTFGVSPMVSDFLKLINMTQSIDSRVNELNNMYKKGGMSRKRTTASGANSDSTSGIFVNSLGGISVIARRQRVTTYRQWSSIKWKPTGTIRAFASGSQSQRRYARAIISGMNGYGAVEAGWQLLPWSWLTDWFGNFGDYLKAHNGAVPVTAVNACTMVHVNTTETYSVTSAPNGISGGGATFVNELKTRVAGAAGLSVSLPFLSGKQVSILSALAFQRYRG
nr:MAG: putative maturation protein [Leviviridae sp.]